MPQTSPHTSARRLRAGEWVEVLDRNAILATLDANGRLDELPFMPEMFEYCGKRFRVWKRAHKTCDTVNRTGGRRVTAAVHLEELRCDGSAHGGCEAACLFFWKEAWLRRVDGLGAGRAAARPADPAFPALASAREKSVWDATHATSAGSDVIYSCQATLLPTFSTLLPWWEMSQYFEDYTSGNVSLWRLFCGAVYVCYYELINRVRWRSHRLSNGLISLYDLWKGAIGGVPFPRRQGMVPAGGKTPSRPLQLNPGDLVQVRTYAEILSTLDNANKNRGLFFDAEEVPFCGKTYRVRSTVTRIIDERSGKMLTLKDRNVILDGVFCQARYSDRRMMCPRAIYSYWRETWLKPAAEPGDAD